MDDMIDDDQVTPPAEEKESAQDEGGQIADHEDVAEAGTEVADDEEVES